MSLTNAVLLFLLFASFSLDIWWTITIDIQLEQQRLDAMVDSIINLINKWTAEGAIPKKVSDKSNKKLQRKMKDLNKTLEDEYKEECRELSKRLSTQNKVSIKEDIICASKILSKINAQDMWVGNFGGPHPYIIMDCEGGIPCFSPKIWRQRGPCGS